MKVGSLFTGIGGFDLGLEAAGMQIIFQCENDPYCQKVLRAHWPDVPLVPDVRDIYRFADEYENCPDCGEPYCARHEEHFSECGCIGCMEWDSDWVSPDLLCGGFPCQDISLIGKREGIDGKRSGLWEEFKRIIGALQPRWVLIENVAALRNSGLDRVLADLAAIRYGAEWSCLRAADIGAPHNRDRIWIVAYPEREGLEGHAGNGPRIWTEETYRSISEARLRNRQGGEGWWAAESGVGRVAHGVSARMDRLRCLGNAVVPQLVQVIGEAILRADMAH
jgi:DNA (cytosine-5)-methyltransferase 1